MKLAIKGGKPIRTVPFPNQANIGKEEKEAVQRVMDTQMLSGYRGNDQKYKGGDEINILGAMWSNKFGSKYSIPINSCTSALHVACGAIGLKPGDEVIVSPYSMTCSATAPMVWGATPIFADVEPDYFCLDPASVESKITRRTKAIIAVDLFGQPFSPEIKRIANKHGLTLIEDAAQAPGAVNEKGKYTGSLGHIGCFSFTQGKHMTAGEGGMITTEDDYLAEKCRFLLNHAEAIVNDRHDMKKQYPMGAVFSYGFNMRMTELQAAILQEQLKKLDFFIQRRQENANYLNEQLYQFPLIWPSKARKNCTHTYYTQAFLYDENLSEGIHRDTFINAVKRELTPMEGRMDEGVRIGSGYIKPLYKMPIFAEKRGRYIKGTDTPLPVVESLWKDELFLHLYLASPTSRCDLDDIVLAFHKVWENRGELQ